MTQITFSRQIAHRASLGYAAVVILLLTITILHWISQNKSTEGVGIFYPKERVNRIVELANAVESMQVSSTEFKVENRESKNCDERSNLVLKTRISEYLELDPRQASLLTERLLRSEISRKTANCRELIQDIELLSDIRKSSNSEKRFISADQVRTRLAEVIAWKRTQICISIREPHSSVQTVHLMGNLSQCLPKNSLPSVAIVNSDISTLIRPLYQYVNHLRQKDNDKPLNLAVTPHPFIINRLAYLQRCKEENIECGELKKLLNRGSYSIVILNAENSEILGFKCLGAKCESWKLNTEGTATDWGSLHIVSPPASTAKLFYAMAIALYGKTPSIELERQIKTSGQLDGRATKRNEWWERQSICDFGKTPSLRECPVARHASEIADSFGWNKSCEPPGNTQCGRVPLIHTSVATGLPAFVGIFGDGRSLSNQQVPYLSWEHYDRIRQNKVLSQPRDRKQLEFTSLTIQSVIGGGDSRVSALGLAQTMASFNQIMDGKSISMPIMNLSQSSNEIGRAKIDPRANSFQAVRRGLEKVLEPAEKGWPGDGTAHPAVLKAFGKPCIDNCGLAGKTGTVSAADSRNAGTTLFMGIANMQRVSDRFSLPFKGPFTKLAIGVIAFPDHGFASEHLASHVAMQTIKLLFE